MRGRLRSFGVRVLPRGWTDLLRQLALFLGAYALYNVVRALVHGGAYVPGYKPFGDAMRIIDLERLLHVFVEPSIQSWVLGKHWLMDIADWTYLNAHDFLTLAVLLFIYLRRNESFYVVRNTFMIAMGIALVGYWLYPTAPPRLLPEWGFTDSVSQFLVGSTGHIEDGPGKALLNLYAAVPSMHVCFAVMIGCTMVRLVRHWPAKVAWALYPVWITFVVVATGNHFLTDVFLGAVTAGVSMWLAERLLARARPDVWAFGQATA